ncbi:MAG: hypothetical protein PUB20_02660 [Clostridia bacterium]|nr:hypothetical protein [Clostridia bacterium]
MSELLDSICISQCASTVLAAMDTAAPEAFAKPIEPVVKKFEGLTADRVLLYNPDAVALWIFQKYTNLFTDAYNCSDLCIPMLSVMPSVTPVCFASMYSGVMPDIHGIKRYEKPVLSVETIFDVFSAAGKKCAIVSTAGDSISKIFLERKIDYYIYEELDEVNEKARELIDKDIYDVIVIYNGNYDEFMHKYGPESDEAMQQLKDNIAVYKDFVDRIKDKWKSHNTFYGFMPDHGCHELDGDCGGHGLDMEEDMNVVHFYGFNKKF